MENHNTLPTMISWVQRVQLCAGGLSLGNQAHMAFSWEAVSVGGPSAQLWGFYGLRFLDLRFILFLHTWALATLNRMYFIDRWKKNMP